jgi:hypothetical protein
MAVRVDRAVAIENWQDFMAGVFPGCTFRNFAGAFEGTETRQIAPRLQEILSEFGEQRRTAVFAVHEDAIVGLWVDPHHNYVAIKFSKASGDEFDGFMVNSLG